jgi:HEAT repeat protein
MTTDFSDSVAGSHVERRRRAVRNHIFALVNLDEDVERFYQSLVPLNEFTTDSIKLSTRELLRDSEFMIRIGAASLLFQLGDMFPEAIRVCDTAFGDSDFMKRFSAASVISSCLQFPSRLVSTYMRLFRGKDWCCRTAAAAALLTYSMSTHAENDDASEAIPLPEVLKVLRQALQGEESYLSDDVIVQLASDISPHSLPLDRQGIRSARSGLIGTLKSLAASAMGRHRMCAGQAVQVLVEEIQKGDNDTILTNVFLLGRIEQPAIEAIPVLLGLLRQPECSVEIRQVVSHAIGMIGKGTSLGKSLVKPLVRALRLEDWTTVCNVVDTLLDLEETPTAALQAMLRMLENDNPHARGMAALLLGKFSSHADAVVPGLIERTKHEPNSSTVSATASVGSSRVA